MSKLYRIIEELKNGNHLKVGNEVISNESVQCSILSEITFFNIDFINLDLTGSYVVACNFKNCRFNNVMLIKSEFWNSAFENCQMENCNLTGGAFHNGSFKNCNFINVDLIGSYFSSFEFLETTFKNSKLAPIGASSIKVCKSKECTEIEESSNLEKILKDMSLITNNDG